MGTSAAVRLYLTANFALIGRQLIFPW